MICHAFMGGLPSGWMLFILQKRLPMLEVSRKKIMRLTSSRLDVDIDSQMTLKRQYLDRYWLFFCGKIVM